MFGETPERGRRNQFDASDYDFFPRLGVFAYYDASDTCHAFEFMRGADVSYDGYRLFAHPAREVRDWARSRDRALREEDGFLSDALGLSMHAPMLDEPDLDADELAAPARSFLVFRPGYYEQERTRIDALLHK